MHWKPELDELKRREAFADQLGGPERVKRQHDGGRLTIRERIEKLADPGSFHEVGKIAGQATYDDQERPRQSRSQQFRVRAGPPRWPAGGDRRRRLHRARRLGGRDHQGKASAVRGDGPRAAPAPRPAGRGLGRRRLGQDHRDDRARQRARRVGLGHGRRQHREPYRGWPWASARWPGSGPPTWPPRTTR